MPFSIEMDLVWRMTRPAVVVPPSISPPLADMVGWWKSGEGLFTDDGVTPAVNNADIIYRWNDASGNGNHMRQATLGNRPQLILGQAGINGLSALNVTGNNRLLTSALAQTYQVAFALVYRIIAYGTYPMPMCWGDPAGPGGNSGYNIRGNVSTGKPAFEQNGAQIAYANAPGTTNYVHIVGVTEGDYLGLWINGVYQGGSVARNTYTLNSQAISLFAPPTSAYWYNGYIAEAIVYGSANPILQGANDIPDIFTYFANKFGTPVPF